MHKHVGVYIYIHDIYIYIYVNVNITTHKYDFKALLLHTTVYMYMAAAFRIHSSRRMLESILSRGPMGGLHGCKGS